MALPNINTYSVDETKICLSWEVDPNSTIWQWNVYGSPDIQVDFNPPNKGIILPGNFVKIFTGLANREHPMTPKSAYIEFTRDFLGIATYDPYFFLITSVDNTGAESSFEIENLHAVPFEDDYFIDESGYPVNVVYRNFEFALSTGVVFASDAFLDIVSLLGRPAREVKVYVVGSTIKVKLNSFAEDAISIFPTHGFNLRRGELQIERVYFENSSGANATIVQVFVAA